MTNMILFVDFNTSGFRKLKQIFPKPLMLFFINLSWHIFYATMGIIELLDLFIEFQQFTSVTC